VRNPPFMCGARDVRDRQTKKFPQVQAPPSAAKIRKTNNRKLLLIPRVNEGEGEVGETPPLSAVRAKGRLSEAKES